MNFEYTSVNGIQDLEAQDIRTTTFTTSNATTDNLDATTINGIDLNYELSQIKKELAVVNQTVTQLHKKIHDLEADPYKDFQSHQHQLKGVL